MQRRARVLLLCLALALVAALTLGACGGAGGGEQEIKGVVTRFDNGARTFTVQGDDGRSYDFKMVAGSKGDLAEIKEHMDLKKPIAVKYRGGSPPYEVVAAD